MKQLILSIMLATLAAGIYAQTGNSKMQTISSPKKEAMLTKTIAPNGAPSPFHVKGIVPGAELAITAFQVKKLPDVTYNGETKHKLQIDVTVRNGGSVAIAAIKVSLDGKISYAPQYNTGINACGASLSGLASDMLNPGESRSTTYYCTVKYDATQHAYYNLLITGIGMNETNLQNNSAQATIPF